jgi:hypothetical protein
MKIRIGHGAYCGANRIAYHQDKYEAIKDLQSRGLPFYEAQSAIKPGYRTVRVPNSFDVIEIDIHI